MNDEEIGLNFFTEGEPRSPEGLPSVFGAIDQAEMLARIDEVQDDDLASSFFADSLIEVEAAATRVFDVGVRPRVDVGQPPAVFEPAPEPPALSPDDVLSSPTTAEPADEQPPSVDEPPEVLDEVPPVVEEDQPVEDQPAVEDPPADEEGGEPVAEEPARVSRLGVAREEVVALRTRTVITVPGILSTSADARRSFILGGPAAMSETEFE